MLLLVLLLPSQAELRAYQTWDRLSWEYQLPPLSLTVQKIGNDNEQGLMGGFDAQGRAVVTISPTIQYLEKTVVHEAVHTMLRSRGVPYTESEENLANQFAYCWLGHRDYITDKPCSEIIAELSPSHR